MLNRNYIGKDSKNETARSDNKSNIDAFKCPITLLYFKEPVMASDGHTYEKSAILDWLKYNDTSPVTGAKLQSKHLIINWTLKKSMEQTFSELDAKDHEIKETKAELEKLQNNSFWSFFYSPKSQENDKRTNANHRFCCF